MTYNQFLKQIGKQIETRRLRAGLTQHESPLWHAVTPARPGRRCARWY